MVKEKQLQERGRQVKMREQNETIFTRREVQSHSDTKAQPGY